MTGPKHKPMKRILNYIEFKWDYVVLYIMTHPNQLHRYHIYMYNKWKERYCTKEQLDDYLRSLDR
jgi:hypothetical protein